MTRKQKRYLGWIIGATLGAIIGFIYWRFIGCRSGSCPITSNPYNTMAWFAVIGILLAPSPKENNR